MKHILKLGFLALSVLSASADAGGKPEAFFENFVALGHDFDPAVASLYSDAAKIHANRLYPFGLRRSSEFDGIQWKKLAASLMPTAKARNDKSIYSDAVVTKTDRGYKIKAARYSVNKCYTDTGYYMVIEPQGNGQFAIVEEYLEIQPQSSCLRVGSVYR